MTDSCDYLVFLSLQRVFSFHYNTLSWYCEEEEHSIMSETEAKETANGLVETPNEYVENGKNKFVACCKFCGSKILDKQVGQYIVLEVSNRTS